MKCYKIKFHTPKWLGNCFKIEEEDDDQAEDENVAPQIENIPMQKHPLGIVWKNIISKGIH